MSSKTTSSKQARTRGLFKTRFTYLVIDKKNNPRFKAGRD